jgi:hypothetical protein
LKILDREVAEPLGGEGGMHQKKKIKNWDRMVAKMKAKFIPKDYQINMFRKL